MGDTGKFGGGSKLVHCTQTHTHKYTLVKQIKKIKIHEVEGRNKRSILETIFLA